MAEERTLALARAREVEVDDEDPSKAALQRRMEETRDSISNTVTEIKETVTQQYETVKDALDWREHFKKQPVAWTLGAAGVGFFVGYGIAAALTDDDNHVGYSSEAEAYARPLISGTVSSAPSVHHSAAVVAEADTGPGLMERFRETSAYDRLSKEAGSLGDRLVEELSTTAHTVVLPLLLNKIKNWIGVDLSNKAESNSSPRTSMGGAQMGASPYQGSNERTT